MEDEKEPKKESDWPKREYSVNVPLPEGTID